MAAPPPPPLPVTFFDPNPIGLKQSSLDRLGFNESLWHVVPKKQDTCWTSTAVSLSGYFYFFSSQKGPAGLCFPCWPFSFPQWTPKYYIQTLRFAMIVFAQNRGEKRNKLQLICIPMLILLF